MKTAMLMVLEELMEDFFSADAVVEPESFIGENLPRDMARAAAAVYDAAIDAAQVAVTEMEGNVRSNMRLPAPEPIAPVGDTGSAGVVKGGGE